MKKIIKMSSLNALESITVEILLLYAVVRNCAEEMICCETLNLPIWKSYSFFETEVRECLPISIAAAEMKICASHLFHFQLCHSEKTRIYHILPFGIRQPLNLNQIQVSRRWKTSFANEFLNLQELNEANGKIIIYISEIRFIRTKWVTKYLLIFLYFEEKIQTKLFAIWKSFVCYNFPRKNTLSFFYFKFILTFNS